MVSDVQCIFGSNLSSMNGWSVGWRWRRGSCGETRADIESLDVRAESFVGAAAVDAGDSEGMAGELLIVLCFVGVSFASCCDFDAIEHIL